MKKFTFILVVLLITGSFTAYAGGANEVTRVLEEAIAYGNGSWVAVGWDGIAYSD